MASCRPFSAIPGTMIRLSTFTPRMWLILAHDLLATAAAVVASFFIRFEEAGLAERWRRAGDRAAALRRSMPAWSTASSASTRRSGASPRCPTSTTSSAPRRCWRCRCWCSTTCWWRRTSTARSSSARSRSSLYWLLQMAFLGGPRIAYRYFRYTRTRQHAKAGASTPTLVARPRRRRRGAAARDRKRRGQENLAGRHPVAVAGRPRPGDPRHPRARRLRRPRSASSPIWPTAARNVTRLVLTPSARSSRRRSRKRS